MADVKISALPALAVISPADVIPIVSSGTTYNISGNALGYTAAGEFTSSTLLAGDLYVSNNIITPLPTLDSYGVDVNQPVVINGDLNMLGTLQFNGANSTPTLTSKVTYQNVDYYNYLAGIGIPAGFKTANINTNQTNILFGTNVLAGYPTTTTSVTNTISIGSGSYGTVSSVYDSLIIGNYLGFAYNGGMSSIVAIRGGPNSNDDSAIGITAVHGEAGGEYCVAVGMNSNAGHNGAGKINIQNTAIGSSAQVLINGQNCTVLGYQAQTSGSNVANEITLGNGSISTLRCNATTITSLSDARDKKDITTLSAGLDFVNALKPVSFVWNERNGAKVDIADAGFIAQDLQQAQVDTGVEIPGLVFDSNPEKLEASYGKLIPVLVKAIQDLSAEVESLKAQLNK